MNSFFNHTLTTIKYLILIFIFSIFIIIITGNLQYVLDNTLNKQNDKPIKSPTLIYPPPDDDTETEKPIRIVIDEKSKSFNSSLVVSIVGSIVLGLFILYILGYEYLHQKHQNIIDAFNTNSTVKKSKHFWFKNTGNKTINKIKRMGNDISKNQAKVYHTNNANVYKSHSMNGMFYLKVSIPSFIALAFAAIMYAIDLSSLGNFAFTLAILWFFIVMIIKTMKSSSKNIEYLNARDILKLAFSDKQIKSNDQQEGGIGDFVKSIGNFLGLSNDSDIKREKTLDI